MDTKLIRLVHEVLRVILWWDTLDFGSRAENDGSVKLTRQ